MNAKLIIINCTVSVVVALSVNPAVEAVAPLNLQVGGSERPHARPDSTLFYTYFKQQRQLGLDVSRIAIQIPFGAEVPSLDASGISRQQITPTVFPVWWFAESPVSARNDSGVKTLLENTIIASAGTSFVSPVLLDEYGPVIVTRELLVGFKEDVTPQRAEAILKQFQAGTILEANYSRMHNVYRLRSNSRNGFEVLQISNKLAEQADVKFAEPDMIRTAKLSAQIPNDPLFMRQWHLHNTGQNVFQGFASICCPAPCPNCPPGGCSSSCACCFPGCPDPCLLGLGVACDSWPAGLTDFDMDAPEAWDVTSGDPSVIVAVFDAGIYANLPDLPLDLSLCKDFTGQGGGGLPVEICDFHGTYVAGIIAATKNNGIGVAGLAPGCRVASARVFISNTTSSPCGTTAFWQHTSFIEALDWSQNTIHARITNHSYGITESAALTTKFEQTHQAGMLHFASVGNNGNQVISYPASLESVYAISGLNMDGFRWSGSNFGAAVDFSAPAFVIFTIDPPGNLGIGYYGEPTCNDYAPGIGTSFASPLAAGVAGLIWSVNPYLSSTQVFEVMRDSANELGDPGWDQFYGWGFVNAYNAVVMAQPIPGDMNCDQLLGEADIPNFVQALLDPAGFNVCDVNRADLNHDTRINGLDVAFFVDAILGT